MRIIPKIKLLEGIADNTAGQYVYLTQELLLRFPVNDEYLYMTFYNFIHEYLHHVINITTRIFGLPYTNRWQWYLDYLDLRIKPYLVFHIGNGRHSVAWRERYNLYHKQNLLLHCLILPLPTRKGQLSKWGEEFIL